MGEIEEVQEDMKKRSRDAVDSLREAIKKGWDKCQPDNRPDESFRAMLVTMTVWLDFMENQKAYEESVKPTPSTLTIRGSESCPASIVRRIEDIGKAHGLLKSIMDDEFFDHIIVDEEYWEGETRREALKLSALKGRMCDIGDKLWDVLRILEGSRESA